LEIDGRFLPENNPKSDDWQIHFRNDKYTLMISHGGSLNLARFSDNELFSLAEHHGPPILAEPDSNFIQLVAQETEIAVYVNGKPVLYANDTDYSNQNGSGILKLAICNMGITPREVRWSNLKVWDISDLVTESEPVTVNEQARAFAEPILDAIANRSPDYEDYFDNSASGWSIIQSTQGQTGYEEGSYFILGSVGGESAELPKFTDLFLDVDIQLAAGNEGDWSVSLRRWFEDQGSDDPGVCAVMFKPDGQMQVNCCDHNQCLGLAEVEAPLVHSDEGSNRLQIAALADQIAVAINGEWVALVTDPYFTGPPEQRRLRFEVTSTGDEPLRVQYDNLRIWDLSDLERD
jgi:hypothetical protein